MTAKHSHHARTSHSLLPPGESEEITSLRLKMRDAARKVFPTAELASIAVETDSPLLEGKKEDLHAAIGVRVRHTVTVDDLDRYHTAFNKALFPLISKSLRRRIRTTVMIFTPSHFFALNEATYPILLKIGEANDEIKIASSKSARKKAENRKMELLQELVATGHAINTIVLDNDTDR